MKTNRLLRVGDILIDVDEIIIVETFYDRPEFYDANTLYNKGLQIHLRNGQYRRINTAMPIEEFERLRDMYF